MQHRHFCYFCKQKSENQMIQTAYYWWKFPTTFQLSEIKIWNMASRTNIFLKCHKGIFCSNIIHRHRITLKLKFQFQYMMSVSRIFNLNVRKQRKSVKAKPNGRPIYLESILGLRKHFREIFTWRNVFRIKSYIKKWHKKCSGGTFADNKNFCKWFRDHFLRQFSMLIPNLYSAFFYHA